MSLLLNADKIGKTYGDRTIFNSLSIKVYSGDRIGITGPNGTGKTTLLRILAGLEKPDEGTVSLYTTISFLRQQDDGVPESASPFSCGAESLRIAGSLDFNPQGCHDFLSGGERAKARFISSFDPASGLLMADEPTSNLDMESADVVKRELSSFNGALMIVSHDRNLLDELCSAIIEINDGEVHFYPGNYSDYVRQRDAAFERQLFEYEAYAGERSRLEGRIIERTQNMKSVRKAPKRMGNSEARLHKRGSTGIQKKLNQSIDQLESRLERLERKDKPRGLPQVSIKIETSDDPVSSRVARARGLDISFDGSVLISNAEFEILTGKRTALLGKNGSGKTTIANMINNRDARLAIAPGVKIGYFMQDFSILDERLTILENVMDGSGKPLHEIRGILARLLIPGDDSLKKVPLVSGGEKVKASIAKLLVSSANMIILDEPTNYLDVFSMEALERVLRDYNGTLLLISHDRKFIENVAERLIIIEGKKVITYEGTLNEYEEFQRNRESNAGKTALDETIYRMKLAELTAKIYSCKDERKKTELEEQYRILVQGGK